MNQQTASKVIQGDWTDPNGVHWDYECVVRLDRTATVDLVVIRYLEGYDKDENPVNPDNDTCDNCKEHASRKASDKFLEFPFDKEEDYI